MTDGSRASKSFSAGWIIASAVAIIGVLVAANTFMEIRIQDERDSAEKSYYSLLGSLASDSPIERIGGLGRLPSILGKTVPANKRPYLFEGFLYVLGFRVHELLNPYHEDLLRVIRTLIRTPKTNEYFGRIESQELIDMLEAIGASGWYKGIPKRTSTIKQESLAWIWKNALNERVTSFPSYSLFKSSYLRDLELDRYQLERADFSNSVIIRSSFEDAILRLAQFSNARLESVSFENADLEAARFENATLRDVDFRGANLKGASFSGANLIDIDWPTGHKVDK